MTYLILFLLRSKVNGLVAELDVPEKLRVFVRLLSKNVILNRLRINYCRQWLSLNMLRRHTNIMIVEIYRALLL